MKIKLKIWIIVITAGVLAVVFFVLFQPVMPTDDMDNHNPVKQEEMLSLTLEWGRLAPLPDSKTEFNIGTTGSMFSRSFSASFVLPGEDLNSWIADSPGLQDAQTEKISENVTKFVINPGGDAGYAEVEVNYDEGLVKTYVSWS
jgi:hypothetical protein